MTALFLAPHNDDEVLWGSFLLLQESEADVIVCLRSKVQETRYGIKADRRERETYDALGTLGITRFVQWPFEDEDPDWDAVAQEMRALIVPSIYTREYETVFAPAVEADGHPHHNKIGGLAQEVFGDRVISYLTYTRSGGRSRNGTEVDPLPEWIERKHRALACYRSQIEEPSCRPWFLGDLREYVSP